MILGDDCACFFSFYYNIWTFILTYGDDSGAYPDINSVLIDRCTPNFSILIEVFFEIN